MTSSGVPVGDTTLLAKLREAATDHKEGFALMSEQFRQVTDALPAVVTLIEAAQRVYADTCRDAENLLTGPERELGAALAPFVGEATQ